jgi:uncharacterized membrane protein
LSGHSGSPTAGVPLGERLQNAGLTLLLVGPCLLAGWSVRTYLQAPGITPRRLAVVLALRLAAFLLALVAVVRPYLGFPDRTRASGVVLVVLDCSESMTIQDEGSKARWDATLTTLRQCQPLLDRLRDEQGLEVEFYRFARDTSRMQLDQPGLPDGKRTDIGATLRWMYDNRDRRPVKALLLISDGRHNGPPQISPLAEARRWKKLCPLNTVLVGDPTTPNGQKDVAITRVTPAAALIQVNTDLPVAVRIDAPGFVDFPVRVRAFLDDKPIHATVETLKRKGEETVYEKSDDGVIILRESRNNEVRLVLKAPATPGEYKLTVKVEDKNRPGQPLQGELNAANNELSTLISVMKGGISVLLVDRPRSMEPQLIIDVLRADPRMRPRVVWMGGAGPKDRPAADNLFQFDREKYDVIILGDVAPEQITRVNPDALKQIAQLVDRGSGLLMLGGYLTFGNGDWAGTPIAPLLPVDLSEQGQVDRPVQMTPTEPGLRRYGYVLGLTGGKAEDQLAAWKKLPPLDGLAKIKPRGGALDEVLARSLSGDPILVTQDYGRGRVLAFAGDTTHRWVRDPDGRAKHSRFWRQLVAWLAHQENAEGLVWVRPDVRDVPVGTQLGFAVGVRGKGGQDLPDGVYEIEVRSAGKPPRKVNTARKDNEDRGVVKVDEPGEYVFHVKGTARDTDGTEVSSSAEARFLVHEEDVEMNEWAADDVFLRKLAKEGRGEALTLAKLPEFLHKLLSPTSPEGRPRVNPWPNWRTEQRSGFLPGFFMVFVALLTAEWLLRRRWGLV